MALITCPECNAEISESAKICPKCGYELTPEAVIVGKKSSYIEI